MANFTFETFGGLMSLRPSFLCFVHQLDFEIPFQNVLTVFSASHFQTHFPYVILYILVYIFWPTASVWVPVQLLILFS